MRPLIMTTGSVAYPKGGMQVRTRMTAKLLVQLGYHPVVLTTSERAAHIEHEEGFTIEAPGRVTHRGLSQEYVRMAHALSEGAEFVIVTNAELWPALELARIDRYLIWDTNECQSLHYSRLPATGYNVLRRYIWTVIEVMMARRSNTIVAISDAEAAEWRSRLARYERKVRVVDHVPFVLPRDHERARSELDRQVPELVGKRTLLFVGGVSAKQNLGAIRWISSELAGHLTPDVVIVLCGLDTEQFSSPPRAGARIVGLGAVDDVDTVIAGVDLCIAPLTSGAGIKTKVLHYLSHGQRVVGTPLAFEGIDMAPGTYQTALEGFAPLTAELLEDVESSEARRERRKLQEEWVADHLGTARICEQWASILPD